MLKGIDVNGEVEFVDIDNKDFKDSELITMRDLLDYICEIENVVEKTWIMVVDKVIMFNEEKIIEVKFKI